MLLYVLVAAALSVSRSTASHAVSSFGGLLAATGRATLVELVCRRWWQRRYIMSGPVATYPSRRSTTPPYRERAIINSSSSSSRLRRLLIAKGDGHVREAERVFDVYGVCWRVDGLRDGETTGTFSRRPQAVTWRKLHIRLSYMRTINGRLLTHFDRCSRWASPWPKLTVIHPA